MSRSVWPRISAVLALLLFLAPALFAAPREAKQVRPESHVFAWLTQALDRFLPAGLKSSGTMDPDGKLSPAAPSAASTSDSSGTMDPDGRI
jgi:hypothetical protein